jgi:hypothetical protein
MPITKEISTKLFFVYSDVVANVVEKKREEITFRKAKNPRIPISNGMFLFYNRT